MGVIRDKVGATTQVKPKSNDESVWLDKDDAEVVIPESLTSTGTRKKSSCLGNVAAFGAPFIAVSVLIGVYRSSQTVEPETPSRVETQSPAQSEPLSLPNSDATEQAPAPSEPTPQASESSTETTDDPEVDAATPTQPEPEQAPETAETPTPPESDAVDAAPEPSEATEIPEDPTSAPSDPSVDAASQDSETGESAEAELPTSTEEGVEPSLNDPEPVSPYADPEETRQTLAQLDYRLSDAQKRDVRAIDATIAELDSIEQEGREVLDAAAPEAAEQAQTFLDKVGAFKQTLVDNQDFFKFSQALDQASLDAAKTREFFAQLASQTETSPEVEDYRRDLVKAATTCDAADEIEVWNRFIETQSESLEKFYVTPDAASAALDFIRNNAGKPGAPAEFSALERRQAEWEFKVKNVVPTQRKIVLRLESEIAQKYWTYKPTSDKCYYLSAPPKVGSNKYVASASGELKDVAIPQGAAETQTKESLQTAFLRTLSSRARQIPDELKENDVAKWYEDWCAFLRELQATDQLDPIVQYTLFRDCVKLLASSDYYFERRLEPITRMLNAPQLAENATIDRFRTDESDLQQLRRLAYSRIGFLPKDYLVVDKTTEQLDSQVEKIAFVYRRVGWLDRDFSNEWRLRRPEETTLPVGDLFALRPDEEKGVRWYKIGSSNGKQTTLTLATSNVPRGSIVFCRVGLRASEPVARQDGVGQFFHR